jgi:hypothetical protein
VRASFRRQLSDERDDGVADGGRVLINSPSPL